MKALLPTYSIVETLHEGARTMVYRADWGDDRTSVILKTLRAGPVPAAQVALFKREYELVRNLDIPVVVRCLDLISGPERHVMVLELFSGQSLERLQLKGRVDLLTFLQVAYAASTALAALHERDVVHGNLSPSNILFNTNNGQVKFIDFGCAFALRGEPAPDEARDELEISYASPEQANPTLDPSGRSAVDYRSDLYSLGVTLYELLTGHLPFPAPSESKTRKRGPVSPHQGRDDVPARLSEILLKLIEHDPARRYQSAAELAAELAAAGMSELPELSLGLRIESARREQALVNLQEAYEEVQLQEEELRAQQHELISTRAQIETERQRYQELFALAPDGYLVTDMLGSIKEANEAAITMLGVDPQFVLGTLLASFVPTLEERHGFFDFLTRVGSSDGTVEWEGRIAPRGSDPIHVVVRCSSMRDEAGYATEIRWLIRDVTDRKRSEEALRLSEERYRVITENGQDVVYRVRLVPEAAFDYISPSVTALLGYTPEEFYANPGLTFSLIVPEDRQKYDVITNDPGQILGPEILRWRRKDGGLVWTEHRNTPIYDEAGNIVAITGVSRDITASKLAEEALRDRELLIEKITTSSPFLIYVIDLSSLQTVYDNHKLEEILGYTVDDDEVVTWDTSFSIVHPDDQPRVLALLEDMARLSDNEVRMVEIRMRGARGEYHWLNVRNVVFARNPDGTVAQVLGTLEDISQRKETEDALRGSEELFRTTVENLQDSLGIYSAIRDEQGNIVDFRIEYVNPLACLTFEMSKEELVGHTQLEFIPPESRSVLDKYRKVVETGEPLDIEEVTYDDTYGGKELSAAVDLRAARFGDGYVATWRDVTERKKREDLLHEREQFIERIAQVTPGIVYLHDMVEGRILYINDQVKALTGLTPKQVMDLDSSAHSVLFSTENARWVDAPMARLRQARDGEVVEFEHRLSHTDGSSRWMMSRAVVFARDSAGAPSQMLAVAYDITERKRIEETVRQANEDMYARLGELSALNRISQLLTTVTDLSSSLPAVCAILVELFKASQVDVLELNAAQSQLTVLAHEKRDPSGPRMAYRRIALEDNPIARLTLEKEQPAIIVPDTDTPSEPQSAQPAKDDSPLNLGWMYSPNVSALMMMPLWSRGAITGFLSIANERPGNTWSQSDVHLAQTVAGTIANGISTSQLFKKEMKQRLLAESLNEIGSVLTGSLDIDTVVHTIFDQLKRVLDYDGAAILLRDGDDLVETQAVGISAPYMGSRLSSSSEAAQIKVLQTRQALCIPDTQTYELWTPPGGNMLIRSWMGAPLVIGDKILGILTVSHTRRKTYNSSHLRLLQTFANQAAIAINNATRFQEAKELAAYEERNRLARELHDSVTQSLFSANLVAKVLPELTRRNPGKTDQALETLARLTESALAEMRTMLLELRPASLAQMPLDSAFKNLILMIKSRSPLEVVHSTFDPAPTLPEDTQHMLYRIVQETLTNTVKHAQAHEVEFNLRVVPPYHRGEPEPWEGEVAIHIADDGKGFDIHSIPPGHLGLQIMSERATSIGAKLELTSKPGQGTQMTIIWAGHEDVSLAKKDGTAEQ